MKTWHIITCEYPPQTGGVSDYTRLLARELHRAGDDVHVWAPGLGGDLPQETGVVAHRTLGDFSQVPLERTRKLIAATPSADAELFVQWVPHGYGYRSMNIGLCNWLSQLAKEGLPISLMVHEPCLESRGSWKQRSVSIVHRYMVRKVLRCASRVFISIPGWECHLRPLAPETMEFEWLPIPATISLLRDDDRASKKRERVSGSALIGHLGTYGKETSSLLAPAIAEILNAVPECNFLLMGSGSEAFRAKFLQQFPLLSARLQAGGVLSEAELSHHLSACDLMLQPYIDGLSSRRTSVMNALSHGVALVTNTGHLTEDFWKHSEAVSLGSTSDLAQRCIALLYDKDKRDELAMRGAALYSERFDWPSVVSKLRQNLPASCSPGLPSQLHSRTYSESQHAHRGR